MLSGFRCLLWFGLFSLYLRTLSQSTSGSVMVSVMLQTFNIKLAALRCFNDFRGIYISIHHFFNQQKLFVLFSQSNVTFIRHVMFECLSFALHDINLHYWRLETLKHFSQPQGLFVKGACLLLFHQPVVLCGTGLWTTYIYTCPVSQLNAICLSLFLRHNVSHLQSVSFVCVKVLAFLFTCFSRYRFKITHTRILLNVKTCLA